MLRLYDLTVEYKTAPLGMDEKHPRFSWKLQSDRMNTRQSAYQIKVTNGRDGWDTGRVEGDQSILVDYTGPAFSPRTEYQWETNY